MNVAWTVHLRISMTRMKLLGLLQQRHCLQQSPPADPGLLKRGSCRSALIPSAFWNPGTVSQQRPLANTSSIDRPTGVCFRTLQNNARFEADSRPVTRCLRKPHEKSKKSHLICRRPRPERDACVGEVATAHGIGLYRWCGASANSTAFKGSSHQHVFAQNRQSHVRPLKYRTPPLSVLFVLSFVMSEHDSHS